MDLIIFSLISFIIYCIYKLYQCKKQSRLRYLVSWSVTTYFSNAPSIRPGSDLIDCIYKAQRNLKIPAKYCFTNESELDVLYLLLEEYQRSIAQKFFNFSLNPPKCKKRLSGEQYFMYMLCTMLKQHQCDSEYLRHNMHDKRISYTEYGSWGCPNYDAVYSLSEFALTYHKLYYVTHLFCKNDPILSQTFDFSDSDFIKKNIDTKQISICCYS